MDLIFLVILVFIGIYGLAKARIQVSSKKELQGPRARLLGLIFLLAAIQLVVKNYFVASTRTESSMGYLLGTAAVVAVVTILFMIFGSQDKNTPMPPPTNPPSSPSSM